ncbi:MAG: hypothetical protein FWF84_05690 [Kiritimatiellaeota bacterium]|nr:hypothetical protein [Kiritimatiellota bacterium]
MRRIIYGLSVVTACAALGGAVTEFSPCGSFDTAAWRGGLFENAEATDAAYLATLSMEGEAGPVLRVTVTAELCQSNGLWVALGTEEQPEALRVFNEDGRWGVLVGGERRTIGAPFPQLPDGRHAYALSLSVDTTRSRHAATVTVSVDGGDANAASHLAPPPEAWEGVAPPETWTRAAVNLLGAGASLRSLSCTLRQPGSVIIVR